MHVIAISQPTTKYERQLIAAHHQLRARVFSDRLGWDVSVANGSERDEFDNLDPTYILAIANKDRVVGCTRLLPSQGPTMATNVFPSLLSNGRLEGHDAMVESSRFCVDTTLAQGRGEGSVHQATLTMFAGIVEWSLANDISEIVTVTDLRFERILARVGWPLQRLGEPRQIGVTMAVAGTLPATDEVFQRLRPTAYQSRFPSIPLAA